GIVAPGRGRARRLAGAGGAARGARVGTFGPGGLGGGAARLGRRGGITRRGEGRDPRGPASGGSGSDLRTPNGQGLRPSGPPVAVRPRARALGRKDAFADRDLLAGRIGERAGPVEGTSAVGVPRAGGELEPAPETVPRVDGPHPAR